jgi:hypothetical protein
MCCPGQSVRTVNSTAARSDLASTLCAGVRAHMPTLKQHLPPVTARAVTCHPRALPALFELGISRVLIRQHRVS